MQTVAIAGVGLIGGSFALALRAAGFAGRIIGVSSAQTIQTALKRGVINEGADLEAAVRAADLVYLAQPVGAILETLPKLAAWLRDGALVTDAGSTKGLVVSVAMRYLGPGQFLGGHPMAGKESRGVTAADAALFRGRPYLLTPVDGVLPDSSAGVAFLQWLSQIGAVSIVLTPGEHDRVVACTSHVPQIASTALGILVHQRLQNDGPERYAGPGLRDMTRLALSDFAIWQDILQTNAGEIGKALDQYIEVLTDLRLHLSAPRMRQRFDEAAETARNLRQVTS